MVSLQLVQQVFSAEVFRLEVLGCRVYADDTVLLSCSAQQLNRLFHIVQYHGQTRGLQINEEKCEHLRLHSDQRIYYSPSCSSPCDCRHCSGFNYDLSPVPLSNEVKYLGVYLDSLSSGRKNLNYRVSQAVSASKLLRPLLSHSSLPPSWKLTVYRSIVLSILTYAMDSALLSPSQIQKMNTVHFKSLRRFFLKSSHPFITGFWNLPLLIARMNTWQD